MGHLNTQITDPYRKYVPGHTEIRKLHSVKAPLPPPSHDWPGSNGFWAPGPPLGPPSGTQLVQKRSKFSIFLRILKYFQNFSNIFKNFQKFSKVCKQQKSCANIFQDMQDRKKNAFKPKTNTKTYKFVSNLCHQHKIFEILLL